MNITPEKPKATSSFHTKANLSQALSTIMKNHYTSLRPNEQPPAFVMEAATIIASSLAAIIDTNVYDTASWKTIGKVSKEVIEIIEDAIVNTGKNDE